ncbi:MAG TPA: M48 family metallopeptidase [Steroidobacteraceae bacterium]|jgi:STE24 endopeptidase|nr:M48 family metallopeptidase [Steroidobacteraceae bacterium]
MSPDSAWPLHWMTAAFVLALAGETAIRLWLATRQIGAVRAHRDHVPALFRGRVELEDQRRAADYTVARGRLSRWATLFEALIKIALTLGGGLALLGSGVGRSGWPEPWRGTLLVLAVLLLMSLLGLPFTLWRTFRVEARFGFNRVTPALFAMDLAKRLLLGFVLGAPLVLATLVLMEKAGAVWWVWAWIVWMAVSLALTWAAPRFIAPLFNKFSPLTDDGLRSRVQRLLERCGFTAGGGVFVMDGSRRSAHGNAYFTGIGRNKRIVFFDTLLARIDGDEIEAVLAHELGHFRLHHVRQRLVVSSLALLAGLALLGWLAAQPGFYPALGVPQGSPAMALILFILVVPAFTFFATPLEAWWSRRHEREADDFAVEHSNAERLAEALVKLYRDNASTLTPDPLHSAFYDSHPPALERISRLQRLALERGAAAAA